MYCNSQHNFESITGFETDMKICGYFRYKKRLESLEKQNEELRSNCDAMKKDKITDDRKNDELTR